MRAFAVIAAWIGGFFTSSAVLDALQSREPHNVAIAVAFSVAALGLLPHD